jgi:amino acid transporter
VLQLAWGKQAADVVTVLILVTAFASVLGGLLGGSRVPYDAARDKVFFRSFAKLHPRHDFPLLGVATMGAITALGFLLGRHTDLNTLIDLLTPVMVIVQAFAQILAVTVLRRRRPDLPRPYRMWLYPAPSIVAAIGWLVIYGYADRNAPGYHPIEWSLAWVAAGVVSFLVWSRLEKVWPFGPREIHETQPLADAESVQV